MQLALDLLARRQALKTAKKAAPCFSILEVNTPMVMACGMRLVRPMEEGFPHKEIQTVIGIIGAKRAEEVVE